MRTAVALAKRDLARYFASPTGYVFITVFVLLSAAAQFLWKGLFFDSNLANLGPLNFCFPYLLLFFVPAVSMSTWADERRHGTDELLLTLPAGDLEIVLGKYFGALGIYTFALVFSFCNVFVLSYLGHPDIGQTIAAYFGYFLIGAALLPVAMIGSQLSESVTVGFVLGALFCAIPVILGDLGGLARDGDPAAASNLQIALRVTSVGLLVAGFIVAATVAFARKKGDAASYVIVLIISAVLQGAAVFYLLYDFRPFSAIASAGVRRYFGDLTGGVISASGLLYFVSIATIALAINYSLLRRRRLVSGAWHLPVRVAFVLVAAASLSVLVGRADLRLDFTGEGLHSVSKETREAIRAVLKDKPVAIQAFVSTEVGRDYVQTRETLLNLLREFDALGGERVVVNVRETKRASQAARDGRDLYGIKPQEFTDGEGGGGRKSEMYLGVVVTCGAEESVIPFLFKGLSVEYELTRAIRNVIKMERRKVGVLATDAKWMGGFSMDFGQFNRAPTWQIIEELKKQYEVVSVPVPADGPITEKIDVLIVPMMSSLSQPAMDNLLAYMKQGKATLIFDDPYPNSGGIPNPNEPPRPSQMGPPPAPRGDAAAFLGEIGLAWNTREIVWDSYNPHTMLRHLPQEIVFVGPGNGVAEAISSKTPITSGLQELVLLFGGRFRVLGRPGITVVPLLKAGSEYGITPFEEFRARSGAKKRPTNDPTKGDCMMAARVTGVLTAAKPGETDGTVTAIVIADIDLIADQFFELQQQGREEFTFDNVTFVLNCVDALAGDDAVVELRKRRPKHRTLETFTALTREHERKLLDEVKQADDDAKKALEEAQKALDAKVEEVRAKKELTDEEKFEMLQSVTKAENGRLAVKRTTIEDEKERRVEKSELARDQAIDDIRLKIRTAALLIPFIPPFTIGLVVLIVRLLKELEARR